MTLEQLRSCTRKRLAELAKEHHLPKWHTLRKEDLIDALDKLYQSQELAEQKATCTEDKPRRKTAIRTPKLNDFECQGNQKPSGRPVKFKPLRGTGPTDELELSVIDNQWFKASWQLTDSSLTRAEVALGAEWRHSAPTLRLIQIDPENSTAAEKVVQSIEFSGKFHEWYLTIPEPGEAYKVELGLNTPSGRFYVLQKSDKTKTESESAYKFNALTQRQAAPENVPAADSSFQNLKEIAELLRGRSDEEAEVHSNAPFGVQVQVTINGTADPEANLTFQGEWVEVHPDGSFQIEMPLADGRQVMPIVQSTNGGREKRTIILALEQNRRELEPQIAKSILHLKPR